MKDKYVEKEREGSRKACRRNKRRKTKGKNKNLRRRRKKRKGIEE